MSIEDDQTKKSCSKCGTSMSYTGYGWYCPKCGTGGGAGRGDSMG